MLPIIRAALFRARRPPAVAGEGLTRRGLLTAVGATIGVVTLSTVGQTVIPLQYISVLAPRRSTIGPQGLPVNNSAVAAGVVTVASDPAYRFTLRGPAGQQVFTLAELAALPQVTVTLPIACVEGWSASAQWTGVRVSELMARVGGVPGRHSVLVESLQENSAYATSIVDVEHAADPLSLIALRVNGQILALDHGYPCRLIAPNRPGAMQTKWLRALKVQA
jgi:DMSO/TMAO reductase YedYZ molybdopterin-dependent catalytic subunit